MKKFTVTLFLLIFVTVMTFSAEDSLEEDWPSIGFGFGNFFENASNMDLKYIGSPGINFNNYSFWNRNFIGMFLHGSASIPVIENDNTYDYVFQYNVILGPGFRVGITDKLKLRFGAGLDVMGLFGEQNKDSVDYSISGISWGVGGDVGLKYEITDIFFVNVGFVFSYNFLQYADVNSSSDGKKTWTEVSSDWTKNYSIFGINPYISIGWSYYTESKYGKPD
jgi:hypothetical protein